MYQFLFSPQPTLRDHTDAALAASGAGEEPEPYVGVQVRNRLWTLEASKLALGPGESKPRNNARVIECMDLWVPAGVRVFFTADDDKLYPLARDRWGGRLRTHTGGVYMPWSRGGKVDAASLGKEDEAAVIKAFVDWFALQGASRIIYTHQSSFGKTAAESAETPNVDVNFTRCAQAEADGVVWGEAQSVTYDVSKVPGARAV